MKLHTLRSKSIYHDWQIKEINLPIYFQDWYLDGVCDEGSWDVMLVQDGDRVVAALPFFLKSKQGFRYITMPPFVKMMGPFVSPAYQSLKIEHELLHILIKNLPPIAGFKQQFLPSVTNWLPFYWNGFQQTTRYTYRIYNLQNLDLVYEGINRNMRRNIKKALTQVTVSMDLAPDLFYQVNQKSFDRQQITIPYAYTSFLRHHEALQKNGAGKIFYASDVMGNIHAVAYLIWDKTTAYYHLAGDDPAFRDSGAGILLIWQAIQYASSVLKVETFDFEGSMLPNVEPIRLQFGASQVPYFYVWKYFSTLYFLLDQLQAWRKRT